MTFASYYQNAVFIKILFIMIFTVFIIKNYIDHSFKYDCAATYYSQLPVVASRYDLVKILHKEGLRTAAEIGVQQGLYAEHLLNNWPECSEYHAIDLWKSQDNYMDIANVPDKQHEQYYEATRLRLKKWENIVRYHRNYSSFAVHDIKDNSLDFIYIDARHDFTGVTEDMELYWPKLKCGGIFAGHDFLDAHEVSGQDWSMDQKGVRRKDGKAVKGAVIEFASKNKRQVLYTSRDTRPSWYFRK